MIRPAPLPRHEGGVRCRRLGLEPVRQIHRGCRERETEGLMVFEDDARRTGADRLQAIEVTTSQRAHQTSDRGRGPRLTIEFLSACLRNGIPRPAAEICTGRVQLPSQEPRGQRPDRLEGVISQGALSPVSMDRSTQQQPRDVSASCLCRGDQTRRPGGHAAVHQPFRGRFYRRGRPDSHGPAIDRRPGRSRVAASPRRSHKARSVLESGRFPSPHRTGTRNAERVDPGRSARLPGRIAAGALSCRRAAGTGPGRASHPFF